MYNHPTVLQRARRRSEDESLPNTKGEIYARSPTQASFHHSPGGRSHSKPSTPLQPSASFNGAHHSPNSPHTALPPITSAIPPRETPGSNYYDPTQDAGDRAVSRGGARYQPYSHDVGRSLPPSKLPDGKLHCCPCTFAEDLNSAEKSTAPSQILEVRYQESTNSLIYLRHHQASRIIHYNTRHHIRRRIPSPPAGQTPWHSLLCRRARMRSTTLRHLNHLSCHMNGDLLSRWDAKRRLSCPHC